MQNKVEYRTSLVSKSLPIKKRIFAIYSNSTTKAIQYAFINEIYGSSVSSEFDSTFTALAYHFVDGKTVERGAFSVYSTKKVGDTDKNITDIYKGYFLLRKDIVVRGTDRDTIACYLCFNKPGTYTYSRKDDNIYISNGDVLIVDGNTLRMKGSSFIWVKVK